MKVFLALQLTCSMLFAIGAHAATPPALPEIIKGRLQIENADKIQMHYRKDEGELVASFDLLFKVAAPEREVFLGVVEMQISVPVFNNGKTQEARTGVRDAKFFILDTIAHFEQSDYKFNALPFGMKINSIHGSEQMDAPIKDFFAHLTDEQNDLHAGEIIEVRKSNALNRITKLTMKADDSVYLKIPISQELRTAKVISKLDLKITKLETIQEAFSNLKFVTSLSSTSSSELAQAAALTGQYVFSLKQLYDEKFNLYAPAIDNQKEVARRKAAGFKVTEEMEKSAKLDPNDYWLQGKNLQALNHWIGRLEGIKQTTYHRLCTDLLTKL